MTPSGSLRSTKTCNRTSSVLSTTFLIYNEHNSTKNVGVSLDSVTFGGAIISVLIIRSCECNNCGAERFIAGITTVAIIDSSLVSYMMHCSI